MIICDMEGCGKKAERRRVYFDSETDHLSDLCRKHWKQFKKKYNDAKNKVLGKYLFYYLEGR